MTPHVSPAHAGARPTAADLATDAPVLEVAGLSVSLPTRDGPLPIVTDVSFAVRRGEALALVGESGCGKSMTASAILGLPPAGALVEGSIRLEGREITGLSRRARRQLCGSQIGFIFQEPMTALHPTLTIGRQMTDSLRHNLGLTRAAATDRALELLDTVGIPRGRQVLAGYVHQLSGGMRQRVMIALAISCGPKLVIADEPTTALDVTLQAQVLDLLEKMRRELDLAMLFITHDLEVVADFCERAVVMYAGDVIEAGETGAIVGHPSHPYTRGLVDALPVNALDGGRLTPIPGTVPPVGAWPQGCRFAPRCPRADQACAVRPALEPAGQGRLRCWHPVGEARQ